MKTFVVVIAIIITGFAIYFSIKKHNVGYGIASAFFALFVFLVGIDVIPLENKNPNTPPDTTISTTTPSLEDDSDTTSSNDETTDPSSSRSEEENELISYTSSDVIVKKSGNIIAEKQEDFFTFSPTRAGTYRFEISGLYAEKRVSLYIKDAGGDIVHSNTWIGNTDGITTDDLSVGQKYTIIVEYAKGFTPYELKVGLQQETIDTNGNTSISDSIQFTGQVNKYSFSPPIEGTYRFEIDDLYAQKRVSVFLIDQGGGTVKSNTWIGNKDGITISDLEVGQQYTILVEHSSGYSPYNLNIGYQTKTIAISDKNSVNGSVDFTDQVNKYSFTPSQNGTYRFEISGLQANKHVSLRIVDEGGGSVTSNTWLSNGDGITTDKLKNKQQYYILVEQESGFTPYTLTVS